MNPGEMSRDELMSMMFAQMVMQQTNMAIIFLGKAPHPQTGKTHQDLDAARLFIDQLEMLEAKTKGNLSKEEEALLKQSLSHLRLAYVEAVNEQGKQQPRKEQQGKELQGKGETPKAADVPAPEGAAADADASKAEDEPRKKFTKKY